MANTETQTRISSSALTSLVSNGATAAIVTGNHVTLIDTVQTERYDRATIQIRNEDNSSVLTVAVWGSLFPTTSSSAFPGTVPTSTSPADSYWVQIGDDIPVAVSSGAIKSISTTGLRQLAVTAVGSGTQTFPIDNCLMFLQGTI